MIPTKCRWLADYETNSSIVTKYLPNVRGKEDIEIGFKVK
jgi:hypothetical protein